MTSKRPLGWLRALLAWVVVFVLSALAAAWYAQSPWLNGHVQRLHAAAPAGEPLPDFPLFDFDGGELRLSQFRGKLVLLDFWASWCPSCRASLPSLAQLQRDFPEALTVLAVNVHEAPEEGRVYASSRDDGLRYLQAPALARRLDIRVLPSTVLLDAQGRIAWAEVGFVPVVTPRWMRAQVTALAR